jgi:hypothetical protein
MSATPAPQPQTAAQPHPLRRNHYLAAESGIALGELRQAASAFTGFNAKTAIVVPAILGSMPMFWFSIALTLCSLPAVLAAFDHEVLKDALGLSSFFPAVIQKVSLIALVAWVAQTFIQLVALPVLQVSSNAQMAQAEHHSATILRGVEHAEDLLDLHTAGGLRALQEHLDARLDALAGKPAAGSAGAPDR